MKKSLFISSMIVLLMVTANQSVQAQRRWSPQAKDATIGGVVGGGGGAIINKRNRAVGGVIGGVVGGAAGYAIGKRTDNRRKEAARAAAAREEARIAAAHEAARREAAEREALAARTAATPTPSPVAAHAQPPVAAVSPAVPALAASIDVGPAPIIIAAYLPNESYGDATAPYGLSKIRRKSW